MEGESKMKRNWVVQATLASIAFALFTVLPTAALAADCTLASAAGTWAYSFSGSVFNAQANTFVPVATLGSITFDGHGKATASETQASPAGIGPVTYTGTYTEDADCSGTITLTSSANTPVTVTVNFVGANDDNEAYLILTSPGFVMAGTTKRVKFRGI